MKYIITTAAFVAFATTATAGSLADPIIEAPIIIEEATSSSSGTAIVVALTILLMIVSLD